MNVINLLSTKSYSGAENVACQIVELLQQHGHNSYYTSPMGPIQNTVENKKIKFLPLDAMSFKSLYKLVKSNHIDIIHAHDYRATLLAVCVAFFLNVKVVAHIHSDFDKVSKFSIYSICFLFCSFFLKKIIWVSDIALKRFYFYKFIKNKSTVIKNVIDIADLQNKVLSDTNSYNSDICYIGRLSEEKNPFRLLLICESIIKQKPNLKVSIVGDGLLKEEMYKYVVDKKMENNITFYGFKSNPYKILNSSKVFLLTSKNEGLPMCILESMACGIPVVSTNVGAIPTVVLNNYTGFCGNDDDFLINSILILLNNDVIRNEISENEKKLIDKNFSQTVFKSEIYDIYEKML